MGTRGLTVRNNPSWGEERIASQLLVEDRNSHSPRGAQRSQSNFVDGVNLRCRLYHFGPLSVGSDVCKERLGIRMRSILPSGSTQPPPAATC